MAETWLRCWGGGIFNPATFSSESRPLCGFTFFSLRVFISSLLMTGSLSCSSHDHISPDRTRGSLSALSLSHAPSLEFSSACTSQRKALSGGRQGKIKVFKCYSCLFRSLMMKHNFYRMTFRLFSGYFFIWAHILAAYLLGGFTLYKNNNNYGCTAVGFDVLDFESILC